MRHEAQESHDSSPSSTQMAELVEKCLTEAHSRGATSAEAGAAHDIGLTVRVRLGEVETVEYQRDRSIGVTVYFGQHKGSASTADFSPSALRETVDAACRIARFTSEDPYSGLADPALLAKEFPDLDLDHPWALTPEGAIDLATAAEVAARNEDKRIINSEGAECSTHRSLRCYGNSHGFLGTVASTSHSISCVVIAGADGEMQRDWWYTTGRAGTDLGDPRHVGTIAAQRALRRLGSRKLTTRRAPVLFSAEVSRSLFSHLLSAATGSSQYRKSSFLLDAKGSRVLPASITVTEVPHLPRGPGSRAFDSEGVATRQGDLVRDGILQDYLLDSYSARRLGLVSNGHAGGWTNILVSGQGSQEALIARMGTGLLVTELMGQGVNMVTGDYSRGAAGFWVENGEIAYPVEEITVAGNLRDMLETLVQVGEDRDTRYSMQVGSVLMDDLAIAGG